VTKPPTHISGVNARAKAAMKLSGARRLEIRSLVKFVRTITSRFEHLGLASLDTSNRVAHDLGEIHGVFTSCSIRMRSIMGQRSLNRKLTHTQLLDIQRELYIHLPYHLRLLRAPLQQLMDALEARDPQQAQRLRLPTTPKTPKSAISTRTPVRRRPT
jgi:hypothetical protein